MSIKSHLMFFFFVLFSFFFSTGKLSLLESELGPVLHKILLSKSVLAVSAGRTQCNASELDFWKQTTKRNIYSTPIEK